MAIIQIPSLAPESNKKQLYKNLTSIGSDTQADICVQEPGVPGVAAHIGKMGNSYVLTAIWYHVRVNGRRIIKHTLEQGDVINVGDMKLEFYLYDPGTYVAPQTVQAGGHQVLAYRKLLEFSTKLATEPNVQKLLELLLDEMIKFTKAEKGFLVLIEGNLPVVKVARFMEGKDNARAVDELSDSIVQKVLETKKPIVISDAVGHPDFQASVSVINFRLTSVMCVPLLYRGELLGLLYLGNNSVTHAFSDSMLEMLMVFVGQATLLVANALHIKALEAEKEELTEALEQSRFGGIIGSCSSMQRIFKEVEKVAATDVSVLICGETGTGKELIAREIHQRSRRAKEPFIVVNCGAIAEDLLESELFGHVRGAFMGATSSRTGQLQMAHKGILFLDEVGEMPLSLQVKILKALQELKITKIGDTRTEPIDVRIIAATHRVLPVMVKEGSFREDLFYKLNVVQLDLPPLRERGNDVLVLASYFFQKYAVLYQKQVRGLTEEAQNMLLNYTWPGNIRQLENRLRRAVVMCDQDQIRPGDLDLQKESVSTVLSLSEALERFRKRYIQEALDRNAGNRTKAARELGVDPRTVFRHLEEMRSEDLYA